MEKEKTKKLTQPRKGKTPKLVNSSVPDTIHAKYQREKEKPWSFFFLGGGTQNRSIWFLSPKIFIKKKKWNE